MHHVRRAALASIVLAAAGTAVSTGASAAPGAADLPDEVASVRVGPGEGTDDLPNPLAQERRERRQAGLEAQVRGEIPADRTVAEVAKGQFVELAREDEDLILTITAEFGDAPSPYGALRAPGAGPRHNEIPRPDRDVDNSTIWTEDFSRAFYEELLFSDAPGAESMTTYYEAQSSNRYSVTGETTDWVELPYNAPHYGRDFCGGITCSNTWFFVQDAANGWYDDLVASGLTPDEIDAELARFDVWDRYDQDGDGDFDEPDGYIDHFQTIHAGQGQEAGGGALGADAIWSHRWYVQLAPVGSAGPTLADGTQALLGGARIGDSSYWIGDYTIEPENGGLGVFVHEYAHDLDLPDLYDTSGNTGGGENGTGFWTLMSSGSNTGDGSTSIGGDPVDMGAWEKLQLGWLDYEVAQAGQRSQHKLGPSTRTSKQAQALVTLLPDKEVEEAVGEPFAGERFLYSGSGNGLDRRSARAFDLPAGATLTAQVDHEIETDWDYAYLEVSTDAGATWQQVATNRSTSSDPNAQNLGNGITGSSGGWTELTADLSAYEGDVLIGFRYVTDGDVAERGFSVDEVAVTGSPVDGFEDDGIWTSDPEDGFVITDGRERSTYFNAYLAAFRQYRDYDANLATGPYNFGFLDRLPDLVESYPYQDGLLVSYWDTSEVDNDVSSHPGSGLILPVDAHPRALRRADGAVWRNRVQTYDSTFSIEPTDSFTLHHLSRPSTIPSQPGERVFDDRRSYWDPANPNGSVITPTTGTQIRIKGVSARGSFMQVEVTPAR